MNVGTYSDDNPNHSYVNSKGVWVTYLILIALGHVFFLSIPNFTIAWAWTCTNVLHNLLMFSYLHMTLGTPWETGDQGRERELPLWDQIDRGAVWTQSKKFLTLVPIVLFILTSFYTAYDRVHFCINASSLCLTLLPKIPLFSMRSKKLL